ncbi:hypothetical protein CerSpe_242310 [Prunus speciosa]
MAWEEFERIFMEKHFLDVLREAKGREFMYLQQRDMTVTKYQARFEELSHFASYMIPDDARRAKRFEDGLRGEIKNKVVVLKISRYTEIMDRAYIVERTTPDVRKSWNSKSMSGGQPSKRHRFEPFQYVPRTPRPGGMAQPPQVCYSCGQSCHIQRFCPQS